MFNLVIFIVSLTALVSKDQLATLAQHDESDYLHIYHTEIYKYSDFIHQYFTLPSIDGTIENQVANTNILVAFVKPNTECFHDILNSAPLRASQRATGISAHASITVIDVSFPPFILQNQDEPDESDNCGQISFYSFNTTIDSPKSVTTDFSNEALIPWINEQMRVPTLTFINHFDFPIQIYWMDESKESVFQGILQHKNDRFNIGTTLGHIFIARQMVDETKQWDPINPIVDYISVKEPVVVFSPTHRLETCENDSYKKPSIHHNHTTTASSSTTTATMNGVHENQYYGRFAQEVISCDNLEKRFFEFSQNIFYEQRQGLNYFQPKIVRPVTANGFEKRRLPEATYAWLKQWYDEQRLLQEQVEGSSGPCMNQNVAPSGITHLTPPLKDKLSAELRDILEGWFGGPLTLTSIYGIRKYTNNSVLRMHVDTVNTHVVSAIINVDQNVTTDWSLIILNHEGEEQRVNMQAGDMVLYESARLLHGRPEPMNGEHYDNIFIHYMPVSGWNYDWI